MLQKNRKNQPDSWPKWHGRDIEVEFIGSVRENVCTIDDISDCPKEIHAKMFINKKPVQFQIDCGALLVIVLEVLIDGYEVMPTTKTLIM